MARGKVCREPGEGRLHSVATPNLFPCWTRSQEGGELGDGGWLLVWLPSHSPSVDLPLSWRSDRSWHGPQDGLEG